MSLEQIMGDIMIAYPNTRPMCSANCDGAAAAVVVSDTKLKTLSLEQQRRAIKVSAIILTSDPWQEACQVLPDVNTLTRGRPPRPTSRPASAPTTSTWSSCTTASPPPSSCTTTTSSCASRAVRSTSSSRARTWRDGSTPVNVSGGLQSKGHPIAATGIANVWEICHHLRDEAGPPPDRGRQGRAWPTSSASAAPAASTSSSAPPPDRGRRPPASRGAADRRARQREDGARAGAGPSPPRAVPRDATRSVAASTSPRAAGATSRAPAPTADEAVEAFLTVVETMAGLGISCVVEYVVRAARPEDFARITAAADCVVVETWCADAAGATRGDATLEDPLLAGQPAEAELDRAERMAQVTGAMRRSFDLPTLRVCTDAGYDPPLEAIAGFAVARPTG